MPNLLEQLKQLSTVVADTGDLDAIRRFAPEDATTNPSLILKAVQSGQYDALLQEILAAAREHSGSPEEAIDDACDRLVVAMGTLILQHVPGRVSTEVNARLSFDTDASIARARRLVALYEEAGVSRDRILIKLAATWEGIRACEALEREGIECNMTLIFSFAQARACAEAGAFLISPFVGRILDWYRKANPGTEYAPEQEPGVLQVRDIYRYFRHHRYPTVVMGASFRNSGEILALAGCDRLTISPALLEELSHSEGRVLPVLADHGEREARPSPIGEAEFRWQLNEDAMATEKLAEGIRGFEADQLRLEALLRERLRAQGR
ncbi:transaldolase [Marinobacterium nitratireducens]|uniref:Transaldolase n=1 Tax=Marinobacterium nitratireducens TaxID=518897 RepID=A0A917ZKI7_9GAMM|nr:transaldolase [Marinobacterium nitratireducens]GGO83507.1 transaldolase [Marinobacterium nitratireducens]